MINRRGTSPSDRREYHESFISGPIFRHQRGHDYGRSFGRRATESALREGLSSLGIDDEFELVVQKKNKAGIAGTDVDVVIKELSPDLLHEKQHALGLEHHHGHEHDHGRSTITMTTSTPMTTTMERDITTTMATVCAGILYTLWI